MYVWWIDRFHVFFFFLFLAFVRSSLCSPSWPSFFLRKKSTEWAVFSGLSRCLHTPSRCLWLVCCKTKHDRSWEAKSSSSRSKHSVRVGVTVVCGVTVAVRPGMNHDVFLIFFSRPDFLLALLSVISFYEWKVGQWWHLVHILPSSTARSTVQTVLFTSTKMFFFAHMNQPGAFYGKTAGVPEIRLPWYFTMDNHNHHRNLSYLPNLFLTLVF